MHMLYRLLTRLNDAHLNIRWVSELLEKIGTIASHVVERGA